MLRAIVKKTSSVLVCESIMRSKGNWARIIVAAFTMTMLYSFACSTTCAVGFCPNQPQQGPSHECDESAAHHSHQTNAPAPDKPDCSNHAHPTSLLLKSVEIYKVQLVASAHVSASAVLIPARPPVSSTGSTASDLAPPLGSSTPVYQQISVLRI